MYILLDTNILISLINEPREEQFLDKLKVLVDSGQLELLVPEILQEEWDRKKMQTVEYVWRMFSDSAQHSHNSTLNSQFEDDIARIKEKVTKVDSLLSTGLTIPLNDQVKIEAVDRSRRKMAPFHGKKTKTINDALIFFSSIEYIKIKKVIEFAFITRDSDYNDSQNNTETLHPDLEISGTSIYYYRALERGLRALHDAGKINYEKKIGEEPKYIIRVVNQGKKNLLDYLYEILSICHGKMRFIPPDIFCRLHPLRIHNPKYNYSYFSGYTLHTNNKEIVDFFIQAEIDKHKFKKGAEYQNSKLNTEKLRYIIEVFNRQLVFLIKVIGTEESVNIRPQKYDECNCTMCRYSTMKWQYLLADDFVSEDTLKRAFVQFQLGYYAESLKSYYNCYQTAKKEGNKILCYQLQYILQWADNHVLSDSSSEILKIKKEVDAFDTNKEYFSFANAPAIDEALARFLHTGNPVKKFGEDIRDVLDKIREHYASQLHASYSNNNNPWNLLSAFAVFEQFTLGNAMPYTEYSDFNQICNEYVEGVFLSYALNEYQSKLEYFDDHVLRTLLQYGNAEHLVKWYIRYLKKLVPYKDTGGTFKQYATNLLDNQGRLIRKMEEDNAWQGSMHLYKMYWNLCLLLSLVKFDNRFVISCFEKMSDFLVCLPKRETPNLKHLASLIQSKGKMLGAERVKRLFMQCLASPHLHHEELFDAFSILSKKNLFIFISNDKEFELFCKFFLDKCEKCGEYHQNILFIGYSLLSSGYKQRLSQIISQKLSAVSDFRIYYPAAIYEIIDYRLHFNDYLFKPPVEGKRHPFEHLEGEVKFRELNNLMNIVFKNKVQLPLNFIASLKGMSDYYDWLLDMKNFDYSKFNPLWIIQYPTQYYMSTIFSFKKVRDKVRSYLKKNQQPTLAYYYTQYVS